MSYHLKFMIPLINEEISKEDISKEAGFINAYEEYSNKPLLCNQIFLLYKKYSDTNCAKKRIRKFENLNNLIETFEVIVDKTPCIMYALTITDNIIRRIGANRFALAPIYKMRILTFWNCSDSDINEYMTDSNALCNHKYTRSQLWT